MQPMLDRPFRYIDSVSLDPKCVEVAYSRTGGTPHFKNPPGLEDERDRFRYFDEGLTVLGGAAVIGICRTSLPAPLKISFIEVSIVLAHATRPSKIPQFSELFTPADVASSAFRIFVSSPINPSIVVPP